MTSVSLDGAGRLAPVAREPTAEERPSGVPGPVVKRGFLAGRDLERLLEAVAGCEFKEGALATGVNQRKRNSLVAWLPSNSFVRHRIAGAVKMVAPEPLAHWSRPQVACYEPGMFFDWHVDAGPQNGHRLWSAVLELQPAEGGRLVLDGHPGLDMAAGDLCVFPSSMRHKVESPTDGARFSVTMWFSKTAPRARQEEGT